MLMSMRVGHCAPAPGGRASPPPPDPGDPGPGKAGRGEGGKAAPQPGEPKQPIEGEPMEGEPMGQPAGEGELSLLQPEWSEEGPKEWEGEEEGVAQPCDTCKGSL